MEVYRITDTIGYDHEQGLFMFYTSEGFRMLPQHFVSRIDTGDNYIDVVCDTKHHTETVRMECDDASSVAEKLTLILEEF